MVIDLSNWAGGGGELTYQNIRVITQTITLMFNILHAHIHCHEKTKINNDFVCLSIPCFFFPKHKVSQWRL